MTQPTPPSHDATIPATVLPPVPRPVTGRVRRRAWQEPIVRFLWLSAVAIFIAALYMVVSRYLEWYTESRLITDGKVVTARVMHPGQKITGRPIKLGDPVEVFFQWQGKEVQFTGTLDDTGEQYIEGQNVLLRVSPDDPSSWTNRSKPTPVAGRFIGAWVFAISGALCLIMATVVRMRFLRLWKHGELHEATVASHAVTALAPRSFQVLCRIPHLRTQVVASVTIPQSLPIPAPGATIQLICNPRNFCQAIPVMTYQ